MFIGNAGVPQFRAIKLASQPWTTYGFSADNFGATAQLALDGDWAVDAGLFRSQTSAPIITEPFLFNTDSLGHGNYVITASPARDVGSTSGEIRISKRYGTETVRSTFYASVKGRDRSGESGGAHSIAFGPATVTTSPLVAPAVFKLGQTTLVTADQVTAGLAYEGVWRDVGQLSLGVQKSSYRRTIAAPGTATISGRSRPWLYNAGAAVTVSARFVVYGSYARGFEEIGNAPSNAANRDEAVPAQLTQQVDTGIKYQILPKLALLAGIFEIKKPYFDLDRGNIFRRLGSTSNRGAEISLAGSVTDRTTVVAGGIFIDPKVRYDGATGGAVSAVPIGPIPGLIRANFQYRPLFLDGLVLDAKVERTSKRYATLNKLQLPSVVTLDAGARYNTQILGRNLTVRLQTFNLTNAYSLTPQASGQVQSLDGRKVEISLAFDF